MKLLIHAGTPKTGSTSIQACLHLNRQNFEANGYYIPKAFSVPGRARHLKISQFYKAKSTSPKSSTENTLTAEKFSILREQECLKLEAEVSEKEKTILLSDEGIAELSPEQFAKLIQDMREIFSEIGLFAYLRRQDRQALSLYHQEISAGGFPQEHFIKRFYQDYSTLLELWGHHLGKENLHPLIYQKENFQEGNIIDDFLGFLEIDNKTAFERDLQRNTSLSSHGLILLKELNKKLATGAESAETEIIRKNFKKLFVEAFPGRSFLPTRSEAREFLHQFEKSNKSLTETWFPGQPAVFNADFSDYPEDSDPSVEHLPKVFQEIFHLQSRMERTQGNSTQTETLPKIDRRALWDYKIHAYLSKLPGTTKKFRHRFKIAAAKRFRLEYGAPIH
ncbi:MAG: hypothetical protein ACPGNV_00195 [Mangrovicoccus sp.]